MSPTRSDLTRQIRQMARGLHRTRTLMEVAVAERLGLHLTDAQALDRLWEGPLAVGELARAVGLTSPATTSLVDRLARHDLARRGPDPEDRRRILVRLTPKGWDAIERALAPFSEEEEALLGGFSVPALEVVRAYLAAMEGVTERHRERLSARGKPPGQD